MRGYQESIQLSGAMLQDKLAKEEEGKEGDRPDQIGRAGKQTVSQSDNSQITRRASR